MSIELGSTLSWYKYTGLNGLNIGIDHFGASGDANQMMKEYGFDARQIAKKYIDKFSN
ncbi:transketolase-like TK C-terminal-containing protein [Pediococcus acidilactici]